MKIKTYQTVKVIISLIVLGIIYYVSAPHTGDNLLFLQISTLVTAILIILNAVEEYSKLFRR